MESQQPTRIILSLLVGLVVLGALPQGLYAAEPLSTRLVLEADRFVVGSRFSLEVIVNTPDPLAARLALGQLPVSLAVTEGPSNSETSWEDSTTGKLTRATRITVTFKVLAPGIVELGPWQVRVGKRDLPVAPVTVFLLAADEAKRRFPMDARWVISPGPWYQGQAIALMLQVRNLDSLSQPGDVSVTAPSGALLEKVTGLGEIEVFTVGDDRIMNIPWGGWMLIPTKEGQVTIPAVKLTVAGLARTTLPVVLDVLALPEGAKTSRAVGNLTYTITAQEGTGDHRGQIVVTQEVTGQGNFPSLVLPGVTAGGMPQVARQESAHYQAAANGYHGSLVVTWRFLPEKAGNYPILLPGFQAFQPATGLVNVWEDRVEAVVVAGLVSEPTLPLVALAPLDWPGVVGARPWGLWGSWLGWVLLFPGVLFLGATFFLRKKGGAGLLALIPLLALLPAATDPAAIEPVGFARAETPAEWSALVTQYPAEPGLWYNKALAASKNGEIAVAIHAYRMALGLGFQGNEAAVGLQRIEEREVLVDQFRPWMGWPADLLLATFLAAWNIGFAFWAIHRLTRRPFWLILASLALLGTGLSGTVLATEESIRLQADAVVGPMEGPLKKVPGPLAEKWMSLRAGTVVRLLGRTENDVLLQTGYGLEGWLSDDYLMTLELDR